MTADWIVSLARHLNTIVVKTQIMKIKLLSIVVAIIGSSLVSCGTKEKKENGEMKQEATSEEEWQALEAFHVIMAEVYHPLKDSGNIQPYKQRAAEFAAEADKFANAKLPGKVDNAKVKGMISSLSASAQSLDRAVKSGVNDGQVGELLEGIHRLFHHIQEEWYGGHDEHKKK